MILGLFVFSARNKHAFLAADQPARIFQRPTLESYGSTAGE